MANHEERWDRVAQTPAEANPSLAEVLLSLSYALDLTGGQPMGHAQRTCLIAMRLASELGLPLAEMDSLYYAILIKDAGCSNNTARKCEILDGNVFSASGRVSELVNWSNWAAVARYAPVEEVDVVLHKRSERGADIAHSLGLSEGTVRCVRSMDEHWDGSGGPDGVFGSAIPLSARIACLAQTLEVFTQAFDMEAAYRVAAQRSGAWFDPQLVQAAQSFRYEPAFWRFVQEAPSDSLLNMDVGAAAETVGEERLDAVCHAFARIVDAKSPFTAEHSSRVRVYAEEIAEALGVTVERRTVLRRTALLHDLGKLAVPNAILDKPGSLTPSEWECVKRHPYYSEQILGRIRGFGRMAAVAAAHHERLDGSGYFRGLRADELDIDMRILAVADVFDAMSARRPYREALPLEEVFLILDKEAGVTLDADCIAIIKCAALTPGAASAALVDRYSWADERLAA